MEKDSGKRQGDIFETYQERSKSRNRKALHNREQDHFKIWRVDVPSTRAAVRTSDRAITTLILDGFHRTPVVCSLHQEWPKKSAIRIYIVFRGNRTGAVGRSGRCHLSDWTRSYRPLLVMVEGRDDPRDLSQDIPVSLESDEEISISQVQSK